MDGILRVGGQGKPVMLNFRPELVNQRNRSTETALHLVAMYGPAEVARELLRRGADPTLKTYQGKDMVDLAGTMSNRSGREDQGEKDHDDLKALVTGAVLSFQQKCHLPECDKDAPNFCGKCRRAKYCSKEHQALHWREGCAPHKKLCKSYAAIASEPEVPECTYQ
eukprot:scaffold648182_cov39-Prasinocladus_malaysianus.AAC.1